MKKNYQRIIILLLLLVFTSTVVTAEPYLLESKEFYDSIAWTWEYYDTFSPTYNCLAYAMDVTNMWIWPWNESPTSAEVTVYLSKRGYAVNSGPYMPKIISYGTAYEITHFAKVIDGNTTRAKWGGYELMTSYSWDPYVGPGCYRGYGPRMLQYR